MNRISYTRATLLGCFALVWTQTSAGQCISYVIVKPFGTITNLDAVRLEILVATSSSPTTHEQPMEFAIVGNEVDVRMWIVGGMNASRGTLTVTVELGLLAPGTYRYAIALHPETDPPTYTADGTFCVEDSECSDAACRCPVFDPQYSIIDLGTFDGGYSSRGQAINDRGDVTGWSTGSNGQHAFLWHRGTMTDLGSIRSDLESNGYDINNNRDVVGYSASRAVLWRDGDLIDLGSLGGSSAADVVAYAINDAGQVVGRSIAPFESGAFLWQDGELINLATTFDAPIYEARDINSLGQIVGGSILLDPDGTVTDLGTLGGAVTAAQAINDHGQIVGYSYRASDSYRRGFVWTDGVMTEFSSVDGVPVGVPRGINNAGQIICSAGGRPWCSSGVLYEPDAGIRRLHDLLSAESGWGSENGWTDLRARDINDAGQIAGFGTLIAPQGNLIGVTHAFLMTPIPDAPLPDSDGLDKNRFISFVVPTSAAPLQETALQIELTTLNHICSANSDNLFEPCTTDGDCSNGVCETRFAGSEGQVRYVNVVKTCQGAATSTGDVICRSLDDCAIDEECLQMRMCDGTTDLCATSDPCDKGVSCLASMSCPDDEFKPPFFCATTGCEPEYRDWAGDLAGGVLHVYGPGIVTARSEYNLRQLPAACAGNEGSCASASDSLMLATARWADMTADGATNARDIAAASDKVKPIPEALAKPRTMLIPGILNPFRNVDVLELQNTIDAVKGLPVPGFVTGPEDCGG